MKKYLQKKLNNEKGMTLIELLAVIVIIAIIAAIAIPAIGNIIDNSRVGAIKSDGQNALQAAELLLIDQPKIFTSAKTTIVKEDLISKYLDDAGSFDEDSSFTITRNTAGQLVLTAIGKVGSVQVQFNAAGKGAIDDLENNDDAGDAPGPGAVGVIAR